MRTRKKEQVERNSESERGRRVQCVSPQVELRFWLIWSTEVVVQSDPFSLHFSSVAKSQMLLIKMLEF